MKSFLVFNNINDLVFWKWDHLFVKHILHLARGQGLIKPTDQISETDADFSGELNPDVVIQIFSPIITSQRIMSCQFGNSYSSVQCRDDTNIVFDEVAELTRYLFVHISKNSVCWMQKSLGTLITIVKYFCGPDVSLLKQERQRAGVLMALNSWQRLIFRDQAALVGASESLSAGTESMTATLAALRAAINALPPPTTPTHAAIYVKNKLLSLYSTRGTEDLIPADTMFLGVMSVGAQDKWSRKPPSDSESRSSSPVEDDYEEQPYDGENIGQTLSWTVLIGGTPYGLHLHRLARNVTLVLGIGMNGNSAQHVVTALHALSAITPTLTQRDLDALKQAFSPLDVAMKKAIDSLKKCKSQSESPQRKLQSQWEVIKKRLSDFLREGSGSWVSLEASISSLAVGLRTAFHLACRGFSPPDLAIQPVALQVHTKLSPLYQFLRVKAMGNFTLGSYKTPVMSRYVEEFPGLVHFLHIDRCYHRLTAPALPHCSEMLSPSKIWAMVEKSRSNLQEGHLSSMWKDGALHYAHLVWFEDLSGGPLKPRPLSVQALRALPPPNTLPEDYYLKLTEASFPGNSRNIRCLELFAVHIGLLPAGTALTHARRLAATICDINAPHPANLL